MEIIYTLNTIHEAAAAFWKAFPDRKVFGFQGEMGAGKTTFIHALCQVKKVVSTVASPTFSIINQYAYNGGHIYHIDLYRLRGEEEAVQAGVEECLYSGNTCLVEWPNRALSLFPEGSVHLFLEVCDTQTRLIRDSDK